MDLLIKTGKSGKPEMAIQYWYTRKLARITVEGVTSGINIG
jgi:hypothetical protein